MKILNFNNFIVEKLGVSLSSIQFREPIVDRALSMFDKFIKSGDRKWEGKSDKIEYETIEPYINKDTYNDFPVVEFGIKYNFEKISDLKFRTRFTSVPDKNIAVGGLASYFGQKRWKSYSKIVEPRNNLSQHGLVILLEFHASVSDKFDINDSKDRESLKDGIESTAWHELNHMFEAYKRTIGFKNKMIPINKRSFTPELTSAGDNVWNFPNIIFKFWDDEFLDKIYYSEEHEIRSNIQEIGYFLKKYPDKPLKDIRIYKNAEKMVNFDPELFYKSLISKISEHKPYIGQEELVAERLKEMWVSEYLKYCKVFDRKPIIPERKLKEMSVMDLINYWSKIFNRKGEYLKRKIHKLKSGISEI
jgi:hypothetical protein